MIQLQMQVAALVIAAATDDYAIRPNDRVLITDYRRFCTEKLESRVYTGSAATAVASEADAADFSSLVVATYLMGLLIVDGTLSADKITSNTNFTNNLSVSSCLNTWMRLVEQVY